MDKRVLLFLNDPAVSLRFKKLLTLIGYNDVQIISSDNLDLETIVLLSPDLVVLGSSVMKKDNGSDFIKKAVFLDLPVVVFSSSAENYFYSIILEKMNGEELNSLHKYLVEEIFSSKKKSLDDHIEEEFSSSLMKEDNALYLLKELRCLYYISDIMNVPELTIDAVFRYILASLEKSLGYYDKPGIRITYLNSIYESENFQESILKIECPIFVNNRELGEIEVFYPGLKRVEKEYFLKMENDLINAVAERIGNYIKSKEVINELKSANDELRKLSSHLQNIRENERKMVASTIHDEFGQKLVSLKYEILNIRKDCAEGGKNFENRIDEMLGLVEASIKTVRDISSNLRPGILDKLGIAAAIQWLARDIESRTEIKFNVICTPEDLVLDDDYTTALFRIFQEAATNIIRHSGASEVIINLKVAENAVLLIVLDNGRGISEEDLYRADSFGIKGMRERVLSFQGSFSIINNDNEGTVIKVSLPLK